MKFSPVNFHEGIWVERDPAARCAIREAYRAARGRGCRRSVARHAAQDAANTILRYRQWQERVTHQSVIPSDES